MPEYDVYIITENDNVEVDIPDIYKDDDSETDIDQVKNYLVEKYNIDFYALKVKIKRGNKMLKITNSIEILDGDKVYFEVDQDYLKQKGIVFEMKSGFSNSSDTIYRHNAIPYREDMLNRVIEYEISYKENISKILADFKILYDRINSEKSKHLINSLMISKFNINFFNKLPMQFFTYLDNNYIYFGEINKNKNICGFGFLYNSDLKIYYEGIFSGLNVFNAIRLDLNNVNPTFTKCGIFENLTPIGICEIIYLLNNDSISGTIKNNDFTGRILHVTDIGIYDGFYKNGKYNGYGKMQYKNGDIYYGYWKNNKRDIYGKMIYKTKEVYIGVWSNDLREEFGILLDKSHNKSYVGSFKNDLPTYNKDEFIILKKSNHNDNTIIGEMEKNIKKEMDEYLILFGVSIFNKSELKINQFVNIKLEKLNNDKQSYYIGQFNNDHIENGFGRLFFNPNINPIERDSFDYLSSNKDIKEIYDGFVEYQCMFQNGKPNGFGIVRYSDGRKYIGNLKNGYFHGEGIFITSNGDVLKAKWLEGKLREDLVF